MTSWVPEELRYAGAEHLDPAFVRGYDRKQGSVPDVAAARALDVLGRSGVGRDSTVVDLGAGTGRFTLAVAPHVRRVVAVDVSPAMLDHLRAAVEVAGLANVECVHAGFLTYEHGGPPADAVYSRNALHQLPDFWKAIALARIASMLRPGGVLQLHDLVYDCSPHQAGEVVAAWLDGAAADPAEGYTADDLAEHVRGEHSTFSWLLRPMLERAGFEVVEERSDRQVYGAFTCLRR